MRVDAITLFPDMFSSVRDAGVTGRAHKQGIWSLHTWNPRDYTTDTHRTVDDRPYGGGPGMVMMAEPLIQAVSAIREERIRQAQPDAPVVLLSPTGKPFTQSQANVLATSTAGVTFVCGRYEGIDQRFINQYVDDQWSLGDFVLSGGEIAAMAMIDAAVRLMPGTLNHGESSMQDSFQDSLSGLLDSPHFTRPETLIGLTVPDVLMSGNHAHIARWRREQSLKLTLEKRPELLEQARARGLLTVADERFLITLKNN
jgi:tRNA (guanine37-N1)-methyltransferase